MLHLDANTLATLVSSLSSSRTTIQRFRAELGSQRETAAQIIHVAHNYAGDGTDYANAQSNYMKKALADLQDAMDAVERVADTVLAITKVAGTAVDESEARHRDARAKLGL